MPSWILQCNFECLQQIKFWNNLFTPILLRTGRKKVSVDSGKTILCSRSTFNFIDLDVFVSKILNQNNFWYCMTHQRIWCNFPLLLKLLAGSCGRKYTKYFSFCSEVVERQRSYLDLINLANPNSNTFWFTTFCCLDGQSMYLQIKA